MDYNRDKEIVALLQQSLKEDIGRRDITTESIIPQKKNAKAVILVKEPCVVCGLGIGSAVFKQQDKNIRFTTCARDGDYVKKGKIVARLYGNARSILTAERVALNFLSHLSGISTKTRKFITATKPYKTKIMDTRKTIPGLRILEKYAVRMGGGFNHRLTLDEMLLIKDNHLKIMGGINKLTAFSCKHKIEIEVKNLKEFKEALKLKPDIIMLDNMSIKEMKKAVAIRRYTLYAIRYTLLEASGRITLKNVKKVASAGVDMISIGALTHSVDSVDISLEVL